MLPSRPPLPALLLLACANVLLGQVVAENASPEDAFYESLTLHPLPDGKLSVLFEFTTDFSAPSGSKRSLTRSHHTLTPPSLLLPLEQNNVSELLISFSSGQWDQRRSSESGGLGYDTAGGGGEVRGWLRDTGGGVKQTNEAWTRVTHALGGLFCAGLGGGEEGENVRTFGGIYPPHGGDTSNLTHYLLARPQEHLCTENLTPFLALLPSKGLSGLSALLAQPGRVFAWGYKAEGIEVIMPDPATGRDGRWRGWWEGVVDLVPHRGGSRAFSLESLFGKAVPRMFPEAEGSLLRLVMDEDKGKEGGLRVEPEGRVLEQWVDGRRRRVMEWDLIEGAMQGNNVKVWWDGEGHFVYPQTFRPPAVAIHRTVTSRQASEGIFTIRIVNDGDVARPATYSEVWPWWVKGWVSEIGISVDGQSQPDLLERIDYSPSLPPKTSSTTLHLDLTLPAHSTLVLTIPFTKLTLKYTEHRPDAERGVDIPSGVLTLLDTLGEEGQDPSTDVDLHPRRTGRRRIYTNRLLLDVPTPDFSMPYNVIIMSSTVMAVFFGLMQGALTRRWGFVDASAVDQDEEKKKKVQVDDGHAVEVDDEAQAR